MTLFIYYFCQNKFGNIILVKINLAILFLSKNFDNIFVKMNFIVLHFKKLNKNEEL